MYVGNRKLRNHVNWLIKNYSASRCHLHDSGEITTISIAEIFLFMQRPILTLPGHTMAAGSLLVTADLNSELIFGGSLVRVRFSITRFDRRNEEQLLVFFRVYGLYKRIHHYAMRLDPGPHLIRRSQPIY